MSKSHTIEPGVTVYDDDGTKLGVITESKTDEFTVSIEDEIDDVAVAGAEHAEGTAAAAEAGPEESSPEEHNPGQDFGEGYIMWRCQNCGEMGELDEGLPTSCPSCGSDEVTKWRED